MNVLRRLVVTITGIASASLLLAGCTGSAPYAPSPSLSNSTTGRAAAAKGVMHSWSRGIMRVPLPGDGCFEASYPAIGWTRVACVNSTPSSMIRRPAIIGNGHDYSIVVKPLKMTGAIGSFPAVTGVTSVGSCYPHQITGGSCGSHSGPNVYSVQLNSNTFATAACNGQRGCQGWTQFVYTNQPKAYEGGGNLIIQNWLLSSPSCPKSGSWSSSSNDCVTNGPHEFEVPNVPGSELGQITLQGTAASSGDSVFLNVGATVYGMQNAQSDSLTDLSQHWTGTEFNVVGNGGADRAVFNTGSTITVSVEAIDGSTTAPRCKANSGSTGEENNLVFVAPPSSPQQLQNPSIVFTESNAGSGGTPACTALAGL